MPIQDIAKVIIIDVSGRVLLLRRSRDDINRPGEWDFPGGGVEEGEAIRMTAIREALEEAGITLLPERLRLVYALTQPSQKGDVSINRFIFASVLPDTPTPRLSHEHTEYKWVPIAEVSQVYTHPVYIQALEYAVGHGLIAL